MTNPHLAPPISLFSCVSSLRTHRLLVAQMIKREVVGRYQGSVMGLTWSFFSPVLMLIIYTFVFSDVFHARWGGIDGDHNSKTQFALLLFVGMIVLNLFSEVVTRAPLLILSNVNYVKKVIFPLEVLPAVLIGNALFHGLVSLIVLLAAFVAFNGYLYWTALLVPLVLLPLVIVTLGLSWILASLGVFLRDISQAIGMITTVLMFLSPVFYPITAVPEKFRPFIMANPLTFIIEQSRDVLIWGRQPDWIGLSCYSVVALLIAWIGYIWFQKTRKGFADVL